MSDAWGSNNDDSNPFDDEFDNNEEQIGEIRRQVQEDKTTDDYLYDTIRTLTETEDLGEEALAHLSAQRETLDHIKDNVDRMDRGLDVADRKITEMENPWAIGPVRTKRSGKSSSIGAIGFVLTSRICTCSCGASFRAHVCLLCPY